MPAAISPAARRPRDIRLDVFRGLCLVIIYIAHVWSNPWAQLIPARFGFSDATEIFVFCSGMASAAAFGAAFRTHGFILGTCRVAYRCWQVFWCHIGVLLAATVVMISIDRWLGTGNSYLQGLGLNPLAGPNAADALLGVLTLRWVPFYFDILPMYLVILAMIPAVVALQRIGTLHAAAAIIVVWLLANTDHLALTAEPWSTRAWFFNPFAWQLLFFTGFAFMAGWLPVPPISRRLLEAAIAVVVLTIPFAWAPLHESNETLAAARQMLAPLIDKSHFGALRYLHFLSLAYLAFVAVGEGGQRLKGPVAHTLRRLGQQSLAVFMAGLLLSFLSSTALNLLGRSVWSVALVNIMGIALLIATARVTAFFKAEPWKAPVTGAARTTARAVEPQPAPSAAPRATGSAAA